MAIGTSLLIVIGLIVLIWVLIEVKRFRHKLFAFFLIFLIIAAYITFTISVKGEDVDFTSVSGLISAGKLYFSWMGSFFSNTKRVTSYAVDLDWKGDNETTGG